MSFLSRAQQRMAMPSCAAHPDHDARHVHRGRILAVPQPFSPATQRPCFAAAACSPILTPGSGPWRGRAPLCSTEFGLGCCPVAASAGSALTWHLGRRAPGRPVIRTVCAPVCAALCSIPLTSRCRWALKWHVRGRPTGRPVIHPRFGPLSRGGSACAAHGLLLRLGGCVGARVRALPWVAGDVLHGWRLPRPSHALARWSGQGSRRLVGAGRHTVACIQVPLVENTCRSWLTSRVPRVYSGMVMPQRRLVTRRSLATREPTRGAGPHWHRLQACGYRLQRLCSRAALRCQCPPC